MRQRKPKRFVNQPGKRCTAWLYGAGGAPAEKSLRIDYDATVETPSALPEALIVLGHLAPAIVIPGHSLRVSQDFENARIVLFLEPNVSGARR